MSSGPFRETRNLWEEGGPFGGPFGEIRGKIVPLGNGGHQTNVRACPRRTRGKPGSAKCDTRGQDFSRELSESKSRAEGWGLAEQPQPGLIEAIEQLDRALSYRDKRSCRGGAGQRLFEL
jgi:hypothetical protein